MAQRVWRLAHGLTLNTLGYATSFNPEAANPKGTLSGRRGSEASPHIALAERIEIEGIGALPFLLTDAEEFDLPSLREIKACFIFAGTAEECARFIDASDELAHLIAWREENDGNSHEWLTWESGEPALDYEQLRAALTCQVTEAFEPNLADARERYFGVRDAREQFARALAEVRRALNYAHQLNDAVLNQHIGHLQKCEAALLILTEVVERRTEELARTAKLEWQPVASASLGYASCANCRRANSRAIACYVLG